MKCMRVPIDPAAYTVNRYNPIGKTKPLALAV